MPGMTQAILFGFHAVGVRLKVAPQTLLELHVYTSRRDPRESGQKCGGLELKQQALRSLQTGTNSSLAYGTKARSEHAQAIGR